MEFLFSKKKKPLSEDDVKLISNAFHGNLNVVRDLLRAGANVNAQLDDGKTALWMASQNGHYLVVRLLLNQNKVDVNAPMCDGSTSLWIASQNGYVEVVLLLLDHNKVNVNARLEDGSTALYVASQNDNAEIVRDRKSVV